MEMNQVHIKSCYAGILKNLSGQGIAIPLNETKYIFSRAITNVILEKKNLRNEDEDIEKPNWAKSLKVETDMFYMS